MAIYQLWLSHCDQFRCNGFLATKKLCNYSFCLCCFNLKVVWKRFVFPVCIFNMYSTLNSLLLAIDFSPPIEGIDFLFILPFRSREISVYIIFLNGFDLVNRFVHLATRVDEVTASDTWFYWFAKSVIYAMQEYATVFITFDIFTYNMNRPWYMHLYSFLFLFKVDTNVICPVHL